MSDYDELLEEAQEKISKIEEASKRFELPDPQINTQGNTTIITNFSDIASTLDRDPEHILKFLARELAASGERDGTRATFKGQFSQDQVRDKLEEYAEEYVFCACGKPDTELIHDGDMTRLECKACGAKDVVKSL